MTIHGVHTDRIAIDDSLVGMLRTDDMERFRAVPKTVMINQWQDDLDWLIIDRTYPAQIARRHQLLLGRRSMVIDRVPGAEVSAAECELRDMVVEYLLMRYPDYFRREGDWIMSPLTGIAVDLGTADPLVAVSLLASEDMLLLLPQPLDTSSTSYVLKAGALLFPNDWSLRSHFNRPPPQGNDPAEMHAWEKARQKSDKAARLGKSPYQIHEGHVSHYMQHFASRVDLFFANMLPGMRTWRRNWGMRLTGELFLHSDALPTGLPPFNAQSWAAHGYLRSEHETFTKLPQSGAIVFSIKTYLWKLAELVKHPLALEALITANDQLASTMVDYRADAFPSFREFLVQHRQASSAL